jgi:multicomponent Na+:H+ antiporter subunit E
MTTFLANILLSFVWVLLTGNFEEINFLFGFIIGYVILWLARDRTEPVNYFKKVPKLISFIFYFLYELFKANLKVAYDVVTPRHYMKPGIFAIQLDAKTDLEITLLANIITLTPGTLTLDVSPDKKTLYIHSMYVTDVEACRAEIKNGFEKKLLEVMR